MADIKTILIVTLIATGMGIGIFNFAAELLDGYGITMEGNFSDTQTNLQNTLSETTNLTEDIQTKVSASGGVSVVGGFAILSKSALAGIKLPFEIISLVTTLFTDIASLFGVPSWVFTVIISVIIVIIVTAVLSAILRKDI